MTAPQTLPHTADEADHLLEMGGDEAPETAEPELVVETTQPDPVESAQPRDDQGRFASPPPDAPTAPDAAPLPAPPTGETPEVVPEPAVETPFSYEADQQTVAIPGSDVGDDGVFIPAAEVPRIKQLLAEGHAWHGSARRTLNEYSQRQQQADRRAAQSEEATKAVEAQLSAVLGHFEQLVEASIQYPPDQMMQSPLGQWLSDIRNGWGVLKAEAKAARTEREAKLYQQRLQEYESQQRETELRPQMDRTLSDHLLHFGNQVGLSRDALEAIYADLNSKEYAGLTWIKAPEDDPINGIRKGETVLNLGIVQREIQRAQKIAGPRPVVNGQPPKAAAPAQVRRPTAPPPTVAAARGPSPQKVTKEYKTKDEADAALMDGIED